MKFPKCVPLFVVIMSAPMMQAQSSGSGAGSSNPRHAAAAFELPRLRANRKAGDTGSIANGRATIHELAPNGKTTARDVTAQGLKYLEIDATTSWASPLRGGPKDITFVSFFVYASPGTSINIGRAILVVRPSTESGKVQMQIGRAGVKGMQWRNFGGPIRMEAYNGAQLAALPVLTVRLDGKAGVWDMYVGPRLGVADLPLAELPRGATKQFVVHAGANGARVCGLISSDDNPLCEDENRNGIDDGFERQRNPDAQAAGKSGGLARAQLARAWQEDQQARQIEIQPWAVQRPLPDSVGNGR